MTTRLGALRHDRVGREGSGLARRLERLDLEEQAGPRAPDRLDERGGVTEGEHDRDGTPGQGYLQPVGSPCQVPRDEADPDPGALRGAKLLLDPGGVLIAGPDHPERARAAYGPGEAPAGDGAHGRRNDRVPNT